MIIPQSHKRIKGEGLGNTARSLQAWRVPIAGKGLPRQKPPLSDGHVQRWGWFPEPVSLISSSLSIYDVGVVSCADASVSGPGASPLYIYDKGLGVSAAAGATSGHL